MPQVTATVDYNGFLAKVARLGLEPIVVEVASTLSSFNLSIEEKKYANGTKGIRATIDDAFTILDGWTKLTSGGIDWTKKNSQGATVGVEVQVSGRSDMLAVDIMHLAEKLVDGSIDAGIIIVPDDVLSRFLTDRTPNLATAIKHVQHRANNLPIRILAFSHDGTGPALAKMRTNLGKL
ncbi:MAG: hypothetical protein ACT4O6_20500 [Reyranella sp.]